MATTSTQTYTTALLDADTWSDFARLVEANNGVWGGCWCMGFHPPAELPNIKNPKAYEKELVEPPDWRIGCIFTDKSHRGQGVARAAVTGVLDQIEQAGGGIVEAYPEQVEGRKPQRGAYFHTGPEDLFAELGFERDRRIAKWRWVMRRRVGA